MESVPSEDKGDAVGALVVYYFRHIIIYEVGVGVGGLRDWDEGGGCQRLMEVVSSTVTVCLSKCYNCCR